VSSLNSYGIFSFALIFLVEGESVLEVTLTLNGLIGGLILGLFSLGIFFKRANMKVNCFAIFLSILSFTFVYMTTSLQGAFWGGLLALVCVLALGMTAHIKNTDHPFLHSSIEKCDCIVNATETSESMNVDSANSSGDGEWLEAIYKVSYMYYSMIGTLLTIFFGLLISMASDVHSKSEILKIKSTNDVRRTAVSGGFGLGRPAHFSVASFTASTGRKLSTFVYQMARDVSQTTLKVENKLKEVISHTNLHHLHVVGGDAEDRVSILNDVDETCDDSPEDTSRRKMFFIGYLEDVDHDGSRRFSNDSIIDYQSIKSYKH